uniref:Secreted protein n=1 Tax=Glossina pallidipes TaxID=7398 RepID=A0A1A9ZE67_GLOPL
MCVKLLILLLINVIATTADHSSKENSIELQDLRFVDLKSNLCPIYELHWRLFSNASIVCGFSFKGLVDKLLVSFCPLYPDCSRTTLWRWKAFCTVYKQCVQHDENAVAHGVPVDRSGRSNRVHFSMFCDFH